METNNNVESLKYLVDIGRQEKKVVPVFEDDWQITQLVYSDGNWHIETFAKPGPKRHHVFRTLESFMNYTNAQIPVPSVVEEDVSYDGYVIFVDDGKVEALFDYRGHREEKERISLPLVRADEYGALLDIKDDENPITQRDLWKLLISNLDGCLDPALMVAISQINLQAERIKNCQIDTTGISQSSDRNQVRLVFSGAKGDVSTSIPTDWTWKGRIWECFDRTYEIGLRMEVRQNGDTLGFVFHPRRLASVYQKAKMDLVRDIKSRLIHTIGVYEGTR